MIQVTNGTILVDGVTCDVAVTTASAITDLDKASKLESDLNAKLASAKDDSFVRVHVRLDGRLDIGHFPAGAVVWPEWPDFPATLGVKLGGVFDNA